MDSSLIVATESVRNGGNREKVAALAKKLRGEWEKMSDDEKKAYTADAVVELREEREKKKFQPHNRHISCFHDARGTLLAVERDVRTSRALAFLWCLLQDDFPSSRRSPFARARS